MSQEPPKKCFCARCFLPIEPEDKVDVEGQNFHRICSMCCICRKIPTSLKMFYGHVFCNECFKAHVLTRFRGENPRIHSNSWWMQWAPGAKPQEASEETKQTEGGSDPKCPGSTEEPTEEPTKRCICSRCLQAIDDLNKIEIGGQTFHKQCAKCYFCHAVPTSNVKIYYGQVFCEECFHRHVLNRNRDNPTEFFKNCFEQWQSNAQFVDNMREFMSSNKDCSPLVFMMQGAQAPFCRCGTGPQDWFQPNEPKKSATPGAVSVADESLGTWDLSFENRTEISDCLESCNAVDESANHENPIVSAAEKIEKLTKYLHERDESKDAENSDKKWKNITSAAAEADVTAYGWATFKDNSAKGPSDCPKCLWQCGPIFVSSDYLQKEVCCGDSFE